MKRNSEKKVVTSLIGLGLAVGLLLPSIPSVAQADTGTSAERSQENAVTQDTSQHSRPIQTQSGANRQTRSSATQPVPHQQTQPAQKSQQAYQAQQPRSPQNKPAQNQPVQQQQQRSSQVRQQSADPQNGQENPNQAKQTPGWHDDNGERHWYLPDGALATNRLFYSKQDRAWFYAGANGDIALNTRIPIRRNPRKPRLGIVEVPVDGTGRVRTGEIRYRGNWYLIDPHTARVVHGMRYLSNGRRWVHYNINTGARSHGEEFIHDDRQHNGWYYFNPRTGKMAHGVMYLRRGSKWVYYDIITGIMAHGLRYLNYDRQHHGWYYFDRITGKMAHGSILLHGRPYYFDRITGIRRSGAYERALLVRTARSFYGRHPNASGTLGLFHGKTNPFGPCAAFVWYVFHTAGLDAFHAGGTRSGWPLDNYWWYRSRGRLSMRPQVGDFAFFWWPGPQPGVSHEGIVVRVDRSGVWVADAIFGGIGEHHTYMNALRGYGHPYWN